MGHGMIGWNMGWGMGLGWIVMIAFWVLVVFGIVALVRWLSGQGQPNNRPSESAIEILQGRYARGEITEKDFRMMKNNLRGGD
jgi:putative membrane protein